MSEETGMTYQLTLDMLFFSPCVPQSCADSSTIVEYEPLKHAMSEQTLSFFTLRVLA